MSLKKDLKSYFNTTSLYDLFGLEKSATAEDVKKAYRKLSLLVHPDRAPPEDKERSTAKFQVVGKAYSILSDEKSRQRYDASGDVDDLLSDEGRDWMDYFRSQFKKVELEDIIAFEKNYLGSDEEKEDVKKNYEKVKGMMNKFMEYQMFYQFDREDRYRDIIREAIKRKEVKDYKMFLNESKVSVEARRKKCEAEARAAEKEKKKKATGGGDADLAAVILGNQQKRLKGLDALAEKYATKTGKTKSKSRAKPTVDGNASGEDGEEWEGLDGDRVDAAESSDAEDGPSTSNGKASKAKNGGSTIPKATTSTKRRRPSVAIGPKEGISSSRKSNVPPAMKRPRKK